MWKTFYRQSAYLYFMRNHLIEKGPDGGRFQRSHGEKRYLKDGPVKTGPRDGHFQGRGDNKRYLLHVEKVKK